MAESSSTRIAKLSALNVQALAETFRKEHAEMTLRLGKTWAEFDFSAQDALSMLDARMAGLPTKGHPRASLHAVRRKLQLAYNAEHQLKLDSANDEQEDNDDEIDMERRAAQGEAALESAPWKETDEPEIVGELQVGPLDPAADFLLDLQYSNLFEAVNGQPMTFRCKGCGDLVARPLMKAHHQTHKQNRSTKMAAATDKPAAPKKPTAKDQGVPAAYLADNGNFKPGYDARLKSDLILAILGIENPKALETFSATRAQKLIDARGWQGFLDRKREIVETKTKAAAAKADEKAKAAKAKADEKQAKAQAKKDQGKDLTGDVAQDGDQTLEQAAASDGDVKPDPKPEPKKRSGGRKVGS